MSQKKRTMEHNMVADLRSEKISMRVEKERKLRLKLRLKILGLFYVQLQILFGGNTKLRNKSV